MGRVKNTCVRRSGEDACMACCRCNRRWLAIEVQPQGDTLGPVCPRCKDTARIWNLHMEPLTGDLTEEIRAYPRG